MQIKNFSSVVLLDSMGGDMTVVNAARVSFDKRADQYTPEQNKKLIEYLAKHEHKSPFNHVFLQFQVEAPLFVARQLVKHKFLVWNEVSRRYVTEDPDFYVPSKFRKAAENVKQGSSDETFEFNEDAVEFAIQNSIVMCEMYKMMIADGMCPEQARMFLPQNMMTQWFWSGSLGAFADMVNLRLGKGAQRECAEVAEAVLKGMRQVAPWATEALVKVGG